jgi:hypothetical protein
MPAAIYYRPNDIKIENIKEPGANAGGAPAVRGVIEMQSKDI